MWIIVMFYGFVMDLYCSNLVELVIYFKGSYVYSMLKLGFFLVINEGIDLK